MMTRAMSASSPHYTSRIPLPCLLSIAILAGQEGGDGVRKERGMPDAYGGSERWESRMTATEMVEESDITATVNLLRAFATTSPAR